MKKVLRTFVNRTKELAHVCFGGGTVSCTPSHPFYVVGKGWVEAKALAAGDGLVTQSGEVALVESVGQEMLDEPVAVYNFEVEGWHTYYVGDSAVLVHNDCDDVDDLLRSSTDDIIEESADVTHSKINQEVLNHSTIGDFTYNPKTDMVSNAKSGGHSQANIDFLDQNGIVYRIEKTYENGVRVGNVSNHKNPIKRAGMNQSWFPEHWDATKIKNAGDYVINMHKGKTIVDGVPIFGVYEGVEVGVIYTAGKPATIFPNAVQP